MSLASEEIAQQPDVLARLLERERGAMSAAAAEIGRRRPRYAVVAARGSSDNVARYAQHLLGRFLGLPVALAAPSLHTLYDAPLRYSDGLVVGISQSGASPDIVAVLEAARLQGSTTVAITNDPGSPLARAALHVIALHAGEEASVAATKTYTASLGAVAALVVALTGDGREELEAMPGALARQLELGADAGQAAGWRRLAVIGRGANYGTAFEAALKIKELTGIVAEPYSPADFLHGPIAVVDDGFPVLAVAPRGPARASVLDALEAVRARGGETLAIGDELPLVDVPEWLSPLVAVVPAQLLAVETAERLGVDVDKPFGLRKITRTT